MRHMAVMSSRNREESRQNRSAPIWTVAAVMDTKARGTTSIFRASMKMPPTCFME